MSKTAVLEEPSNTKSLDNGWLGGQDSNLDSQIQSLMAYRWPTPHQSASVGGTL